MCVGVCALSPVDDKGHCGARSQSAMWVRGTELIASSDHLAKIIFLFANFSILTFAIYIYS